VVSNAVALSPYVTGSIWHEFESNATGRFAFTLPTVQTVTLAGDRIGTFYQGGAGISAEVLNTGFLAFLRTDFQYSNKFQGASIVGGARLTFGQPPAAVPGRTPTIGLAH
jgi:hypothetical protein